MSFNNDDDDDRSFLQAKRDAQVNEILKQIVPGASLISVTNAGKRARTTIVVRLC